MNEQQNLMLSEAYAACLRINQAAKEIGMTLAMHISPVNDEIWVSGISPSMTFRHPFFYDFLNREPSELYGWEKGIIDEIKERISEVKANRVAALEAELAKLKGND